MKAIIFGANGQDGFYLRKLLIEKHVEVIGVSRTGDFLRTDIKDRNAINDLIKIQRPDFIFHFAANSTTSHTALFENHDTISTGTLNILEAVKQFSPNTKVFISGSALQFVNIGNPIKEIDPFAANDAYSVSRTQSVYAARYFRSLGLKIYVGYFFNHDSPLRSERHIAKKISETAKRIAAGSNEKLVIGDMSVVKEWSFAGDIVNSVWLLINQENIFEANLGSGSGYSIEQWIEKCFLIKKLNYHQYTTISTEYSSPYTTLICNNSVIKSLGYIPLTNFEELAELMMK